MDKGELRARRTALEALWRKGLDGRALLQEHAALIDAHIAQAFSASSQASDGFAVLAVGGYGRRELFPFSDIDILLLHAPEKEAVLDEVAAAIFYPLWDCGLEVGHSVRTVEACLDAARKDFFFEVSLLDARLLAGSQDLFAELVNAFQERFIAGLRPRFFEDMVAHRTERHQRYGRHSYMLEPHIKESRGGLRDIQAMLWTAQVVFGLRGLAAIEDAGLLSASERQGFDLAWDGLMRVRNQLHYLCGRKNDQLFFEHQEEMAKALGFEATEALLGVERFMRGVYGHMQTVTVVTDLFFEHVADVLQHTPASGATLPTNRVLEPGIELLGGRIVLSEPDQIVKKPTMMRIFLQAAKTGAPLHHRTCRLIRAHLHLVDDTMRRSLRISRMFLEVLTDAQQPLALLETLRETGFLFAYLPELREVESLAQHDVYHVYTVDFHLIHTVAELHALAREMPGIFQKVAKPHVLFLAGLLHDIGKGRGEGHAERGASLAATIGERLGLFPAETAGLAFLVEHHLYLPHLALRRDLEDEALILRCARQIGDPQRLAMLYLLAIADSRATGPNAWSQWKAALLQELYLKIAHVLDSSLTAGPDLRQGAQWMRQRIAELAGQQPDQTIQSLPDDYLLSFSPEEVALHLSLLPRLTDREVLIFPEDLGDHWSLLIITRDRPGLLSRICGTLALHSLQVLAARIFTWPDGTVVDVLEISSILDNSFAEQDWEGFSQDLILAVNQRMGLDHRLSRKLAPLRQTSGRPPSRRPAEVVFDNHASEGYTVIEVFADDRIGLLYEITRTLADFGIDICRAKISTKADQLVDVFYVRDLQTGKIRDPALQEEIRMELLHVVKT